MANNPLVIEAYLGEAQSA
ncbi:MAG: hypothetical protein OEZ31_06505 [Nitrospirota bacterium]|nr:hypothetical protein [Nitrospirota bacterium]MDH5768591.1 hypothetical protein [Nitrospirota bacterium]